MAASLTRNKVLNKYTLDHIGHQRTSSSPNRIEHHQHVIYLTLQEMLLQGLKQCGCGEGWVWRCADGCAGGGHHGSLAHITSHPSYDPRSF